jgi:hypothetical protein
MNSNIKTVLISLYFGIGLCFAVYQHFWGQYSYKPFMFNIGQGLVWPLMLFPSVGKFIGGILILLFVGVMVLRSR